MEERVRRLERQVEQQSYFIWILMAVLILDTSGLLVLWQEKGQPDYDHIAVAMTVFQTMFGIAALYGFWALRGLTKDKAEEVARAEIREIAPPIIQRSVQDSLQTFREEAPISKLDTDRIVDAIGRKEDGDGE